MAKSMRRIIRGKGNFISDMYLPGMLYGQTVRSPVSRGTVEEAEEPSDGALFVRDIPGSTVIDVDGAAVPVLADGEVRYVGEPIALVAAESQRQALAAAALALPPVAPLPPAYQFEHFTEDQIVGRKHRFSGNPERELSDCFQIVEGRYRTGVQDHLYSEPHGAIAVLDGETMVIHVATQWPHHVQRSVAAVLGIKERACRVIAYDPGVALDGKLWYPSVVAAHAALLANSYQLPVKLVYSSVEDFRFSPKRAPVAAHYITGHDSEGRLVAAKVRMAYNAGAYALFTEEILAQLVIASLGLYHCHHYDVEAVAVKTNLPPMNCYAGFGIDSGFFAAETHVARITEVAQLEPYEWRTANLATVGAETVTSGRTRVAADPAGVLSAVADAADFSRRSAAYELQKKRRNAFKDEPRTCHGIGIAFAYEPPGALSGSVTLDGAAVKVRLEQGGTARILCSAVAGSSAVSDYWRTRVAEILELDPQAVQLETRDTSVAPDAGPAIISKNVTLMTELVEKAATAVKRRRFRNPLPIEVRKAGRRTVAPDWNPERLEGSPFVRAARAAAVVEVAVDPNTLECRATDVWLCIDAGKLIDEEEARRAVEMSVYQALDWSAGEGVAFRDGAIDQHGLVVYRERSGTQRPALHINLRETPGSRPRGVANLPYSCVPAAFAAAVSQATGFYIDRVPSGAHALHDYMTDAEAQP